MQDYIPAGRCLAAVGPFFWHGALITLMLAVADRFRLVSSVSFDLDTQGEKAWSLLAQKHREACFLCWLRLVSHLMSELELC